jgi:hypothetical protein
LRYGSEMEAWVVDEYSKDPIGRQLKKVSVDADAFRAAFAELTDLLPGIPERNDGTVADWEIEEVKVVLDVTVSGGLALVGTASVGVKGGVEVKFRRNR